MKNVFLTGVIIFAMTGFYSCEKEVVDNSALCTNGILDELAGETEVDCGGDCEPCAPIGTLTCVMKGVAGNVDYTGVNVQCQVLGPSLRVFCSNSSSRPLNFMFRPDALNQPLYVVASSFDYAGEPYITADGDTGSITITAHDTVRHIISGRFDYNGQRVTKSFIKCVISDGVFTNVRY
jgi:hypothetical protein